MATTAHDDNDDDPRTNRKISPSVCHEGFGDIKIGNDAAAAAWRPPPQRTEAQQGRRVSFFFGSRGSSLVLCAACRSSTCSGALLAILVLLHAQTPISKKRAHEIWTGPKECFRLSPVPEMCYWSFPVKLSCCHYCLRLLYQNCTTSCNIISTYTT